MPRDSKRDLRNSMPPSWKSDEFLAGELTPEKRREWLERTGLPYSPGMEHARSRHDAIQKLRDRGVAWFDDADHYRAWPKYCKCPGGGTVDAHNQRFELELEAVTNDGR